MKKYAAIAAIAGVLAFGGTAAAEDYPPGGSATTMPAGGGSGGLPATGSESNNTLAIAGGALVAGAGLLGVTKLRRRHLSA
jgi:LPXTG-motif cell wall-anchored protein